MKIFLNKFSFAFLLLFSPCLTAAPIDLVPHKEGASSLDPLASPMDPIWEGTPPAVIEERFSKIPVRLTSPTLRNIRKILLTETYEPLQGNVTYEAQRLSLLTETGEFREANELLSSLPDKEARQVDLLWLEGATKKACEKVTNLIRTSPTPEWKRQNIFCLYTQGEQERARIATELLKESDPEAARLMATLFDKESKQEFKPEWTHSPFLLTFLSETGGELPEGVLSTLPPSFVAIVARGKSKANEDAKALSTQYGLADAEQVDEGEPTLEALSKAAQYIRQNLKAGHKEKALKWGALLMREAPEQARAYVPLLHFISPDIKWGQAQLQAWQAYHVLENPNDAPQKSYILRNVLMALGEEVGMALKGEPNPPSWRQEQSLFEGNTLALLDSAVASQRKGEVLLLVLTEIGETPLKEVDPHKMIRFIKALHSVGYDAEARALALEYLLATVV